MPSSRTRKQVSTENTSINTLLTRGVERAYPSRAFLEARLRSGDRLTVYLGIDPTGPTLHLGHLPPLLKLREFQKLGHRAVLLIGDFTGMIGDPTGRTAARKRQTRAGALANAEAYRQQAGRIISFSEENTAELRYNSEWLGKLSLEETLDILAHLTEHQLVKRDMFQRRIAEGRELYMHEFLYPIMHGYDSVAMNVDGEVGGNDQTFNMLVGRDLMKKMVHKEKFVLSLRLLEDASGKKMGKTEGNMVAFSDSPADSFGAIMSWPDEMIIQGFELCTLVPQREINEMYAELQSGANPKETKLTLAESVVLLLHGREESRNARDAFESTFRDGRAPESVPVAVAAEHERLMDIVLAAKPPVVSSKTEFRRLAAARAITRCESGEKITSDAYPAEAGTYRFGKRRFLKIERRVGS